MTWVRERGSAPGHGQGGEEVVLQGHLGQSDKVAVLGEERGVEMRPEAPGDRGTF